MQNRVSQPDHTASSAMPRLFLVTGMILAAALFRLVPHPPNFTPIGAMALFGGAALASRRLALLIPLLAMFLSDLFLGFDSSRPWVYGSIVLITFLGQLLRDHRHNPAAVALGSLGASVLFFVVTNFGVWVSGMYGYTGSGFVLCYIEALPFFRSTVSGDLVFCTVLFGGLAFLESRVLSPAAAPVES